MYDSTKEGMAMNYPKIGQTVEIHSYKHNSNIHRIWQETTILDVSNGVVIGANHKTLVMESDGMLVKRPLAYDEEKVTLGFKEDTYNEQWKK